MTEDIFFFLCSCHDQGFIPDMDTLTDKFPHCEWDTIVQEVKAFVNIHEMDGVKIGGLINEII